MIDAIMHIGLSKSGSSALQYAFSKKPVYSCENDKYNNVKYVSIDHLGHVSEGETLSKKALCAPCKYIHATDLNKIDVWTDETFRIIKNQLLLISNNGEDLIVLSNEGWSHQADLFKNKDFFEQLNIKPKAICYARNPVELINSSWWQWGAWSGYTLNEYTDYLIPYIANFHLELSKWSKLIGSENLTVRVLPDDILVDFGNIVGIDMTRERNRNNTSLPAEILRFYQKHPELRPSEHDSSIDFILTDILNFDGTFEKTPWVLSKSQIEDILNKTKLGNEMLLTFLDEDSKQKCIADQRWWHSDAFKDKKVSSSIFTQEFLPYEALDKLLLHSLKGVKKLSLENLELKKQLLDQFTDNSQ